MTVPSAANQPPDLAVGGDEGRADLDGVAAQRAGDEAVLDQFVGD